MAFRTIASIVALGLGIAVHAAPARGDAPLAKFGFSGSLKPSLDGNIEFRPFVSYGDPILQPALGYMNNVSMTAADVLQGNTKELTGDFANFAAQAVNGVDNTFYVGIQIVNGGLDRDATTELANLSTAYSKAPGVGAPDYAGYTLTRVVAMPTSLQVMPSGLVDLSVEFTVYGDRLVPEPSLLSLAGCGAAGLALFRRRRQLRGAVG